MEGHILRRLEYHFVEKIVKAFDFDKIWEPENEWFHPKTFQKPSRHLPDNL